MLAIRKAMDGGASLRQALRLVGLVTAASQPSPPPLADPKPMVTPTPEETETITRSLRAFFHSNQYTRDHAAGLAVKLGHADEDVRVVAERLCATGVLVKSVCQGMSIFHQAGLEAAHA